MQTRTRVFRVLMGAALVLSLATLPAAAAQPPVGPPTAPGQAKKYRATSAIVVDTQTGQRRLPTVQEVDDLVATLSRLTTQVAVPATATTGRSMNLETGFEGVVVGRANEDGTVETRCVYSFDEGAAFLGLVAVEAR